MGGVASADSKPRATRYLMNKARRNKRHSAESGDEVVQKAKQWLEQQSHKLSSTTTTQDWALLFDRFCTQIGKQEVSFDELNTMFVEVGTTVNRTMLRLMFSLFDADANGVVDRNEFLVSLAFLSQATQHNEVEEDMIDLAYVLFDTNRGGTISKREFNNMCLVLVNKAKFVLAMDFLREAFRLHLRKHLCEENLDFYEAVEELVLLKRVNNAAAKPQQSKGGKARPSLLDVQADKTVLGSLPYADCKQIFDKYISSQADKQVNVSSPHRTAVERALQNSNDGAVVDMHIFDDCIKEIVGLLETDALPRFKEDIKHTLADRVWKQEKLGEDDRMDKNRFRQWASKHPDLFSFLKDLQTTLLKAQTKQRTLAATKIQRAWRMKRGTVYVLGKVLPAKE